jgi:sugar/nucleoside kinase (ribokinase family)
MPTNLYLQVSGLFGASLTHEGYSIDNTGLGGSGANTISLAKIINDGTEWAFDADIIAMIGQRQNGPRLREILDKLGISPVPDFTDDQCFRADQAITAAGFVFLTKEDHKPAKKKIAGYVGNALDILTVADIDLLFAANQYKIVYLSGNAREKFGHDVANRILEKAIEYGSQIILTAPTQSRGDMAPETRDFFRKAAEHAIIVSANLDEHKNTFATNC